MTTRLNVFLVSGFVWCAVSTNGPFAQPVPRARSLGVPFEGTPGPLNAITDVRGV